MDQSQNSLTKPGTMTHAYIPVLRRQRLVDAWSLLAREPGLITDFSLSERLCLKIRWTTAEEKEDKVVPWLHMHAHLPHMFTCTHMNMHACVYTCVCANNQYIQIYSKVYKLDI